MSQRTSKQIMKLTNLTRNNFSRTFSWAPLAASAAAATMFLWPLLSGLLFSNAQYSAPLLAATQTSVCDSSRLLRCQQDIVRDVQTASLNAASVQYPLSGPPYSPAAIKQRDQQSSGGGQFGLAATACRLVRSNLDCLLLTTPACYENGLAIAQNNEIILRAKRFLEHNNCNEPDPNWQSTFCYRSTEVGACEERYGFTAFSPTSTAANLTACIAYQAFKYCLDTHLRLKCKITEIDMANEYLIDRAGDLAWRCPLNQTANLHYNPYALNNQFSAGQVLSPSAYGSGSGHSYGSGSGYEQRPIPSYVGSQTGRLNLFGANSHEQAWERFRNPLDEARYGISRLPGGGGSGEIFDRLVATNGFEPESSDCPVKAAPFARECENNLIDQQRLARDSRDGNELQRRICCSLIQYRDCVSRVVLDRCADSSPTAVDILMGVRRRELSVTCRNFNRDLCSGALATILNLNKHFLVVASLLATFMTFKQRTEALVVA